MIHLFCSFAAPLLRRSQLVAWLAAIGLTSPLAFADPIPIEYDPNHPSHYKPFPCLSIDTSISGSWGGLRNSCGFDVEAYWYDAKNGAQNTWTIAANDWYPLFNPARNDTFACRRNESFVPGLGLCRESARNPSNVSDADQLARELGLTPSADPATEGPVIVARTNEVDQLAADLGLLGSPTTGGSDADAVMADIQSWQEVEDARIEAERQRVAAVERARVAAEEAAARERAAAYSYDDFEDDPAPRRPGFLGTLLGAAAGAAMGKAMGVDPRLTALNTMRVMDGQKPVSSVAGAGMGGAGSSGSGSCSQVEAIIASCPESSTQSVCGISTALAQCMGRALAAASGCPSHAAEIQRTKQDAEASARAACVADQGSASEGTYRGGSYNETRNTQCDRSTDPYCGK